jgi:hypothetical protein
MRVITKLNWKSEITFWGIVMLAFAAARAALPALE